MFLLAAKSQRILVFARFPKSYFHILSFLRHDNKDDDDKDDDDDADGDDDGDDDNDQGSVRQSLAHGQDGWLTLTAKATDKMVGGAVDHDNNEVLV